MLEVLESGEKVLEKAANLGEIGGDRLVMGSMSVVVWMMVPLSFSRYRLAGETIGCTPIFPEGAGITGWGALLEVWVRSISSARRDVESIDTDRGEISARNTRTRATIYS